MTIFVKLSKIDILLNIKYFYILNGGNIMKKSWIIILVFAIIIIGIISGLAIYNKNGKSKKQKFILTELPIPKSSSDTCKNFRKKHPELIVDNFTKNEN